MILQKLRGIGNPDFDIACHSATCLFSGPMSLCIRSEPMATLSFECFANTGVYAPATIFPSWRGHSRQADEGRERSLSWLSLALWDSCRSEKRGTVSTPSFYGVNPTNAVLSHGWHQLTHFVFNRIVAVTKYDCFPSTVLLLKTEKPSDVYIGIL